MECVCGGGVLPFAGVSRGMKCAGESQGVLTEEQNPGVGIAMVNTMESSSVEKHLENNQ